VSTQPYQLGEYLGYHLDLIISDGAQYNGQYPLYDSTLTIVPDTFLLTDDYARFLQFREQRETIKQWIKNKTDKPESELSTFVKLNPEYYQGYVLAGNYFYQMNDTLLAKSYYQQALTKEMENTATKELIEKRLVGLTHENR
jgi:hypothetical protein